MEFSYSDTYDSLRISPLRFLLFARDTSILGSLFYILLTLSQSSYHFVFFCSHNFSPFFSRTLPIERMIIYLIFALTQYQNDIVSSVCEVLEKLKAKREITCFVKLFRWKTKWADKLYKPYKKLRFSESKRHREFWLRSFGKTTNKERDNNSREFILTKN